MEFDDILKQYVGQFGRFQILMLIFISIEEFFMPLHTLSPVFMAMKQEHHCHLPEINGTNYTQMELQDLYLPHTASGKLSSCLRYDWNLTQLEHQLMRSQEDNKTDLTNLLQNVSQVKCDSWTHDTSIYKNTMVKEWDLVCDRQYVASSVSSLYMTGSLMGNIVFGPLTDWVGRKPVVLGCGFMYVLAGLAMALVPSLSVALAMRFILAFCGAGKTTAALVILTEFVGPDYRVLTLTVYFLYWVAGYVVLSGLAYLIQDWRTLQLVISAPELLFFIAFFFIVPESPRWLLYKQRKESANPILQKMARMNKTKLPDDIDTEDTKKKVGTVLDLIRTPGLRKVSLIIAMSWFTNGFVYYGLSLNTSNLAGNAYLNTLVSGAIELPAYLIILLILRRFGRVNTYVVYMLMAGVSLLCIMPIPPGYTWPITIFSMIGKFCISSTFQGVLYYSAEIFPTEIRAIGLNYAHVFTRIGSILGSYMDLLGTVHSALQFAVFGAVAIVAGVLYLPLPETRGAPMTQTARQAEHFIQNHPGKLSSCCQQVKQDNPDLPLQQHLKDKTIDADDVDIGCDEA